MAVVRIPCAAVDLSSDPVVAGGIFDERRWWRVSHCTHPPKPCAGKKVLRLPAVAVVMSVYPTSVGHFVPEQWPKVLLLHRHLPPSVPILVADSPPVRRYMAPLISAGVLPSNRVLFHKLSSDGTVVHADHVYTVLSSHFSNVMSGDIAMMQARAVLDELSPPPVAADGRSHILLIDRSSARTRRVSNTPGVITTLRRAAVEVGAIVGAPVDSLGVRSWSPAGNISADVAAFRRAAMIVAPHGAGLANMIFASAGTPVIEICYDDFGAANTKGMACPAMYAAMAVNLHLPYWVVTGAGAYGTSMAANLTQLGSAAAQALHVAYGGARHTNGAAASGKAAAATGTGKAAGAREKALPRHWKELPGCGAITADDK